MPVELWPEHFNKIMPHIANPYFIYPVASGAPYSLNGAWANQGSTANYGFSTTISGSGTSVGVGDLIVTACQVVAGDVPTVSDTIGNTYTVTYAISGSSLGVDDIYTAYCVSTGANAANVVSWTNANGANISGNVGGVYHSNVAGSWTLTNNVSGEAGVGYGTVLTMPSISTSTAGIILGMFFEYYVQAYQGWTITGVNEVAEVFGTNTGTGAAGCIIGDLITTGAQPGFVVTVTDGSASLSGGKVYGVVQAFNH